MLILFGLAIILAVTAATGFFVALEFAYTAVDRTRLHDIHDNDPSRAPQAKRALHIVSKLSFALSGAQLGITVTALFVGFFAEPYLGRGLANVFGLAGVPAAVGTTVGVVLSFLLANAIQMIIGELGPKNLAIARTESLALWLSRPTQVYLAVFGPLIRFFDAASTKMLRMIGIHPVEELEHTATTEDLHHIIDHSRDEGTLGAELSQLLDRGLDFSDITAEQASTPRVEVETLPADATVADAVTALHTGHSRFPIVGNDVDDVRGVIGLADIVGVDREQRASTPAVAVADPALLVPGSLPLPQVLDNMRHQHRQMVCVVDEYGGFDGIITWEDLAEELVGDIRDEQDRYEAGPVALRGGAWIIPGRWRIDEIADATGIKLPDSPHYETIGGLVMAHLGRIPYKDDAVTVPVESEDAQPMRAELIVISIGRHVPQAVELRPLEADEREESS
ncbi:hemolysin family protein [Haloglycomyces albus]|uniref:hemolysin family protein n=1 Tax=Haloglycomyces albus TaxID=526067 RepID=UPI00046CA575|nr:hemolysin family protein [Haloglycomyces albus]